MISLKVCLFIVGALVLYVEARQYTRCGLVQELIFEKFTDIENWVCLAESASNRTTNVLHSVKGQNRYGLFQISPDYCNEHWWPGKKCSLRCKSLLGDSVKRSARCAKLMYKDQGFKAFPAWVQNCEGQKLPDITACLN